MYNKSQSAIKQETRGQVVQRLALRTLRKPKLLKSPLHYTNKRFTPRINSSFAEYDESRSPKVRFRSTSVDRPRRASGAGPSLVLRSLDSTDPSSSILNVAKKEIQEGRLPQAIEKLSQLISVVDSVEAVYHRGLCYMAVNKFKEAIIDLAGVVKENSSFVKSAYIQLIKCFQCINDFDAGIRCATQAINRFNRLDEVFLIRAQLYSQKKYWDKAKIDYKKYLKHNPHSEEALIGVSEVYEKVGDLSNALRYVNFPSVTVNILLRKCRLLIGIGEFQHAVKCADAVLAKNNIAEAFWLKAECHKGLKQYIEAALSYEQCLMYEEDLEMASKALFNLGALKIREKDFYGALHTFSRCTKGKLREQKILEIYAEAVISLMKRDYKEGIKVFNKLLKSKEAVIEDYIQNCYCCRAYGFLALSQYDKCIQNLKKAAGLGALDKASIYNNELAHALLHASKLEFVKSSLRLDAAMRIFPRKVEPFVYKSSFLVFNAYKEDSPNISVIRDAEYLIEQAVAIRDPDSELLFYRAIIRYLLGKHSDSVEDMKQCIEKAEDNISDHYVLKALCEAALKQYKDAIQDFTIAIQLNELNSALFAYRGRCGFLVDDTSLAFADFQKFVIKNDTDPKAHFQAGVLLLAAGSYEDSQRALENSLALQYSAQTIYLLAKCSVMQNKIAGAISELEKLLQKDSLGQAELDLEILQYLHGFLPTKQSFVEGYALWDKWQHGSQGEIFDAKYILWFKAVYSMFLGQFDKALEDFQVVLDILHAKDTKVMTADETLTSEEENCEVLYNIAICHLFGNKAQSALILEDLSEILNNKHKGQMLLLAALIHLSLDNSEAAERLLKEAFRCDPDTVSPYLAKKGIKVLPLNTANHFAETFPLLSVEFTGQPTVEVRPAISLPRVNLPTLEFSVQNEVHEMFSFRKIAPKPEAPWLNRVKGTIQFTEAVVDVGSEPTEMSERETKPPIMQESEESKRRIKSFVPLRHNSSEAFEERTLKVDAEETPSEIVKKIQALCKRD